MTQRLTATMLVALLTLTGCSGSSPSVETAESVAPPPPAAGATAASSETIEAPPAVVPNTSAAENAKLTPSPEELTELVTRIGNDRLSSSYEQASSGLEENPDLNTLLTNLSIWTSVGSHYLRDKDQDRALLAFSQGARLASVLIEKDFEIPEGAMSMVGSALYNGACADSLEGRDEQAMDMLAKAFSHGFEDFELLSKDPDLDAVRKLPGFDTELASWKKAASEKMRNRALAALEASEPFPFDFELTDIDGKEIMLSQFEGKVTIVDIWGTWCPPCREEIPSFIKLQEKFGSKGFQMVGLNKERSQSPEEANKLVKDFIGEYGINYPCALITKEIQDQVPNFRGYPTTLFIDKTGKVRMTTVGLHSYSYLESIVTALLED